MNVVKKKKLNRQSQLLAEAAKSKENVTIYLYIYIYVYIRWREGVGGTEGGKLGFSAVFGCMSTK